MFLASPTEHTAHVDPHTLTLQDLLEEISDLKRALGAVKAREADAKAALSMEATMVNKRVKELQLQLNDADERQRELQRVRRVLKNRTAALIDHERLAESRMALQRKVRRGMWSFSVSAKSIFGARLKHLCERRFKKPRFKQRKNMHDSRCVDSRMASRAVHTQRAFCACTLC